MNRKPQIDALNFYLEQLRNQKIKITLNRRKVLEKFLDSEKPWTLTRLNQSFQEKENCQSSSIYRALNDLHHAGILETFHLPGERQKYFSLVKLKQIHVHAQTHAHAHAPSSANEKDHHHHIVCETCGTVSHLDICMPNAWLGKVENRSGFQITEHHLEFKGLCEACQ